MKQVFILVLMLLVVATVTESYAQAPQSFKYQSIARDGNDVLLSDANINLEISIHDLTPTGTVVYKERHSTTTNTLGLFTIPVGGGEPVSGNFSTVDWGTGAKFIEVAADLTGGTNFASMGISQLLSVPYALWSENSKKTENASVGQWYDMNTPSGWTQWSPCKCRKVNGWIEFRGRYTFPKTPPDFYFELDLLPVECRPTQGRLIVVSVATFSGESNLSMEGVIYSSGELIFFSNTGISNLNIEGLRIWGDPD